ncbi:MAG TPA: helix-turn-helix transcriptional regulator [Thermoanaerobaculia bacterium]|nr:helix-turn-helix transcriptional regulator [Thermoanaerobaculia bacterium]
MAGAEEHPDVLRTLVLFLRSTAGLNQTGLGQAVGLSQSKVSQLESSPGQKIAEETLRRIAAVAGVPWPLVARLRRFLDFFLSSLSGEAGRLREADPRPRSLSAAGSYLLEELAGASRESPDDLRLEAARFWEHVKDLPAPRRRRAVELSPRASRSWALAERLCHESETAAPGRAAEALELADLALGVAQRVEGEEGWRRRVQGYAWAYAGNARRAANDLAGAEAAFATAWKLWRKSGPPEGGMPLSEGRMLSLEAALRRDQGRSPEALELLARARRSGGGASGEQT